MISPENIIIPTKHSPIGGRGAGIVQQIWSRTDTILFIFAGSAAEFALNRQVDWLYFTGKIPNDPIGRLFSTVEYAQKIIFEDDEKAKKTFNAINLIHKKVETDRGAKIPDWAYQDVLYMLIDYSVKAFELLERRLTKIEKEEIFEFFKKVGEGLNLKNLPDNYAEWLISRHIYLEKDLENSHFTQDLYKQYKRHLGWWRYILLLEVQKLLVPGKVNDLLQFPRTNFLKQVVGFYKKTKNTALAKKIKYLLLPSKFRERLMSLEKVESKLKVRKCPFH